MEAKLKRLDPKTYEIIDCEDSTFIGRKIRIDYDKNCFNGVLNLSKYYDLDTAGDLWDIERGQLIGFWEEI